MHEAEQLSLDYGAPAGAGAAPWAMARDAFAASVEACWELPVGRRVRVRVAGFDDEVEGILRVAEFPPRLDARLPLRLRVGDAVFAHGDVEALIVLDGGPGPAPVSGPAG